MYQTTTNSKKIKATQESLYKALTTPEALEVWQVPGNMTGKVHTFDLKVGGGYQMSLFYPSDEKENRGKTTRKEDRFTVKFLELVPPQKIVQGVIFVSDNPAFSGEMIIEISLDKTDEGTKVTFFFKNIPPGIRPEDNETGTLSSLEKLADYVKQNPHKK